MDYIHSLIDIVFHLDVYLADLISVYKHWIYLLLFVLIFCETGLVVAAFLPGDSLLFVTGTLAAIPANDLNVYLVAALFIIAAITGDSLNYMIGRKFGERLVRSTNRFIKKKHLEATHQFYDKYGGKTIVLARFVPFVRTFAPFVAGMGKMHYERFLSFNVIGALIWVLLLVFTGFFLGNLPVVRNNLQWFIIGIILLSNLPAIVELGKKARRKAMRQK